MTWFTTSSQTGDQIASNFREVNRVSDSPTVNHPVGAPAQPFALNPDLSRASTPVGSPCPPAKPIRSCPGDDSM